ncbi:MAG TPA: hypothetical protein VFC09_01710 [Candidatus Dormibacteraeota bacterium]|nr:hypothetical protein [Candidatus Dormibacteraeota bacterium]
MQRSWALVGVCIALAVVFAGMCIFYATTPTSFLADAYARHTKHAVLFALLAVVALAAASFARPRSADT